MLQYVTRLATANRSAFVKVKRQECISDVTRFTVAPVEVQPLPSWRHGEPVKVAAHKWVKWRKMKDCN